MVWQLTLMTRKTQYIANSWPPQLNILPLRVPENLSCSRRFLECFEIPSHWSSRALRPFNSWDKSDAEHRSQVLILIDHICETYKNHHFGIWNDTRPRRLGFRVLIYWFKVGSKMNSENHYSCRPLTLMKLQRSFAFLQITSYPWQRLFAVDRSPSVVTVL